MKIRVRELLSSDLMQLDMLGERSSAGIGREV